MLDEFLREQREKQAQLKQQRVNEKTKTSKNSSIQCGRRDIEKSEVEVMALQTITGATLRQ